jgi:hypothetical protein
VFKNPSHAGIGGAITSQLLKISMSFNKRGTDQLFKHYSASFLYAFSAVFSHNKKGVPYFEGLLLCIYKIRLVSTIHLGA